MLIRNIIFEYQGNVELVKQKPLRFKKLVTFVALYPYQFGKIINATTLKFKVIHVCIHVHMCVFCIKKRQKRRKICEYQYIIRVHIFAQERYRWRKET